MMIKQANAIIEISKLIDGSIADMFSIGIDAKRNNDEDAIKELLSLEKKLFKIKSLLEE